MKKTVYIRKNRPLAADASNKEQQKPMQPKYKRILLKLSGEALAGDER